MQSQQPAVLFAALKRTNLDEDAFMYFHLFVPDIRRIFVFIYGHRFY